MRAALWIVQVLLAVFFLLAGLNHGVRPWADTLVQSPWAASLPVALVRFIGWCEIIGAIGLILPAMTRIKPGLTTLAATGLLTIMLLAILFHLYRGEPQKLPMLIVVAIMAAFVLWGRARARPFEL